MNSVVQTGVKSAGWEKKTTHLPLKSSGKLIGPCVVSALKDGAFSPINGSLILLVHPRSSPFLKSFSPADPPREAKQRPGINRSRRVSLSSLRIRAPRASF